MSFVHFDAAAPKQKAEGTRPPYHGVRVELAPGRGRASAALGRHARKPHARTAAPARGRVDGKRRGRTSSSSEGEVRHLS